MADQAGYKRWQTSLVAGNALFPNATLDIDFTQGPLVASENELDPLMLAAQAYQESELDHDRESPAGAVGIMQIKPSTAADRNVGIDDISNPSDNIEAVNGGAA